METKETPQQAVIVAAPMELDSYELSKPSSLIKLAASMQKYIDEQKLFSIIQGKKFPNVEAWQFAGMSLGILPVLVDLKNLSNEKEIKYQATVDLIHITTQNKIGSGIAVCSNLEGPKKSFAEYAIASMAQTRAVGKAYRLMLSFLMKSAGFEVTPAEELEDNTEALKLQALVALTKAASRDALISTYKMYKAQFDADIDFSRLLKIMTEKFPKAVEQPA